jgi:hypothetical protein
MGIQSGQVFVALILGVLLAASLAWVVAGLYRRRMVALMRGGAAAVAAGAGVAEVLAAPPRTPPQLDRAANRRVTMRLLTALTGVCLLVALTQSWFALSVQFQVKGNEASMGRLLVLGAVYAWPMVLAWGLALRWPWSRVLAGIALYIVAMIVLVMLRSNAQQSLPGVVGWLATEVGVPLAVTLIISASGRIRAVAPYLLPPALVLSSASILALQALSADVAGDHLVAPLVGIFGATGTIVFCALAPWLVLAWPVYALGRVMAGAYRNKRFSDLGYLFAVYWFVILMCNAVPAFAGVGVGGFTLLLPWLWIPVGWWLLTVWRAPAQDPPNLLVLRVFQHDAQVGALFDQVIERWRFTGNTLLIAGTDLVSRTLDPDDLFTFLDGQLCRRFIDSESDVPKRLAEFDLRPDPDGRYRVNECYCRDTTWQAALTALVNRCDVVLMDLRGFQAQNRGCRHELGVLAKAANLRRVVVLYDGRTDRGTAEADIGTAPPGRFLWLDAGRMNVAKAREVLSALFSIAPGAT